MINNNDMLGFYDENIIDEYQYLNNNQNNQIDNQNNLIDNQNNLNNQNNQNNLNNNQLKNIMDKSYDYEIFLNCIIQIIYFIIMLMILIEFYFIDKIKLKLTNDIINNVDFYIKNIDFTKDNLSNQYLNAELFKKFDYDKYIDLINNNKSIFENVNQNIDYVYLILLYILLLLIFIILFFIFTRKITFNKLILLFLQNTIIFIIIGIFQYYYLDMIISNYSFIYNNNFSNSIINVIKSYKLI